MVQQIYIVSVKVCPSLLWTPKKKTNTLGNILKFKSHLIILPSHTNEEPSKYQKLTLFVLKQKKITQKQTKLDITRPKQINTHAWTPTTLNSIEKI